MTTRRATPEPIDLAKALRGSCLVEPPSGTLRRAIALGAGLVRKPTFTEWVLEVLFDSGLQPVPLGVRKSMPVAERRLLFAMRPAGAPEAERQLDVRLRREPRGTLELAGQVLPPTQAVEVEVTAGRTRRAVAVDAGGEFLFRDVPACKDALQLAVRFSDGSRFTVGVPLPAPVEPKARR